MKIFNTQGSTILDLGDAITHLRGASLTRADLTRADLRDADLTRADLRYADLSRASLTRANLRGADLSGANLRGADLSGADLRDADLSGANLTRADLRDADLTRAGLRDADLTGANLSGANLSGAPGLKNFEAMDWFNKSFKKNRKGVIVYKCFNGSYPQNPNWNISPGSILSENCGPLPTDPCACGINFATKEWVQKNHPGKTIWKCLIAWAWLPGVVIPWGTDGKARCSKLMLLEEVKD